MEFDFADLDGGLGVGEVREIGDDLREDGAEVLLEGFDGIEVEVTDGEIGSGRVGHHAGDTVVDVGFAKSGADELMDERNVFFAVVGNVEVIAGLIGIHDGDFDHGEGLWRAKRGVLKGLDNGEEEWVKGEAES